MEKDIHKRILSDIMGMDIVSRQHPFNIHRDKPIYHEEVKHPKMTAYKKPSLLFRIIRRGFHIIFIIFGIMFVLDLLSVIWR